MKNNVMEKDYYALVLFDPATPSFCSFDKLYIGQEQDMMKVADNLERKNEYPETAKAICDYFAGNKNAVHHMVYRERPVLTPVFVIEKSQMRISSHQWEHTNVWGFPYLMRFASADVSQIIISHNSLYYRCIRAVFTDLQYEGMTGKWTALGDLIFGNDCVLDVRSKTGKTFFENILYVVEDFSIDKNDLSAKMSDQKKIIYKGIIDEVIGDG